MSSSANHTKTVIIVGASGQVGHGIFQSFQSSHKNWNIIFIDPKTPYTEDSFASNTNNNTIQFFHQCWEDIPDDVLLQESFLKSLSYSCFCNYLEVCYAAEDGNRDVYSNKLSLGDENNHRFTTFLQRLRNLLSLAAQNNRNSSKEETNINVHISYCGGSWTRRKTENNKNNIISDDSIVKQNGGDNVYEQAKTSAYQNAETLYYTLHHKDWCSITFYDYISVVPNYSPNFTIHKMVEKALFKNSITYSAGDEYGRPLLHSRQAGDILRLYAENRFSRMVENDNGSSTSSQFNLILLPGYFIKFETFATICREEVLKHNSTTSKDKKIAFEYQQSTPDFLKLKCVSLCVQNDLSVQPELELVLDGLRDTAIYSIRQHLCSLP